MIGWSDPVESKIVKAVKWLKSLTHDNFLYPETCFSKTKPPPCIFIPDEAVFNKMIEAVAKGQENMDRVLTKFNDYLLPKPQWLIEQEILVQERQATELRIL